MSGGGGGGGGGGSSTPDVAPTRAARPLSSFPQYNPVAYQGMAPGVNMPLPGMGPPVASYMPAVNGQMSFGGVDPAQLVQALISGYAGVPSATQPTGANAPGMGTIAPAAGAGGTGGTGTGTGVGSGAGTLDPIAARRAGLGKGVSGLAGMPADALSALLANWASETGTNAGHMGSMGNPGPTGPGGSAMAPGMLGLGYGLLSGQQVDPGFALASLAQLGAGPFGLAVGALGRGLTALGFQPSLDPHGYGGDVSGDKSGEKDGYAGSLGDPGGKDYGGDVAGTTGSASDPDSEANSGMFSRGGKVTQKRLAGPNPPGKDDGYAALDAGEYVVNAKAAKKHGPALRRMNAGA